MVTIGPSALSQSYSSSTSFIRHHPSSSIIIHHHPSSSIIIHHHPSSSSSMLHPSSLLQPISLHPSSSVIFHHQPSSIVPHPSSSTIPHHSFSILHQPSSINHSFLFLLCGFFASRSCFWSSPANSPKRASFFR